VILSFFVTIVNRCKSQLARIHQWYWRHEFGFR